MLLGLVLPGRAANITWTGAAGDNNVFNPANWSPAQVPTASDVMILAGGTGLTPQMGTSLTVGTLSFKNTAQAFTLGGAGTYTINGGGLVNNSTFTETINNAIKLGATQNWKAGSGAMIVGGAVNLQTFKLTSTGNKALTINGAISGTGAVTQNGAGSLVLSGNNTYSGTTTLAKGTLSIGSNTALGTGTLAITGSGLLDASGAARTLTNTLQIDNSFTYVGTNGLTFTGPASLTNNSTITANGAGALALNGVVSGTKELTKAGTGTLALHGANTFSGGLLLNAGTTIMGSNTAAGTGTLSLKGGTIQAGGAARTLANPVTISAGTTMGGTEDLTFSGATTLSTSLTLTVLNPNTTFNGVVSGGGRALTKAGAGPLLLSGANTYSGGTFIKNGTIVLNSNTAAGDPTKTITVGDATAGSTTPATLLFSSTAGRTVANPISVPVGSTGLRTIGGLNTSGVNTFTGAVTLATGVTLTAPAGGEVNFTGLVSGAGGITKTGAGTIRLGRTAVANTFTGATLVSDGRLAYGANNALGTGTVTINGPAAVLDLGAFTDSVGSVTLQDGSITGTGTSMLTSTAGFTLRNGSVSARLAGAVALTKDTAGTVTLSGANTYTGGTNINAGTLLYGASNVLTDAGALTLNGGTLNIGTFSDTVGAVTLASGSILGSSGVLTGTGYTLQSGTVAAALNGSGNLTKTTAGTVLISGAHSYTGSTAISAGTLRLGAAGTLPDGTAVTLSAGATLDLNNSSDTIGSLAGAGNLLLGSGRLTSGGSNASTTFAGSVGGTGGLTKTGTGTLTLSGTASYSGSTDVNAGSLALGNAAAGPTASRVNVAAGATFNVAGYNAAIGSLAGAGSVTLGAGTLTTGGDLTSSTFSGIISGTGGLNKTGTGTMTLTGSNTFSGALTVTAGTLTLSGAAGRASSATSISFRTGGTLVLDNTAGENPDRLSDSAAINIQGGDLHFVSDSNGSAETVGALNFLLGPANITVEHNGTPAHSTALTFSAIGGVVTGTSLNFAGTGGALGADLTGPQIYIANQSQGLLGSWAHVGPDFAEYSTHGVRAYTAYYTGSLGLNVNDPGQIVLLSATSPSGAYTLTNSGTTRDGGLSITDLPLVDLNTDASRVLNLTAGGLIKSGLPDSTISGAGRLTAGDTAPGAFNITVDTGSKLTIASQIIDNYGPDADYATTADNGSIGVVKAGTGTLVLAGANSFSGGVYVNEGSLEVGADENLGASANDVLLNGGALRASSSFTPGTGRRFLVTSGLTGGIEVAPVQALTITGASDLLATGDTASRLVKSGAGDLVLGAANVNFTGTMEITAGAVELRHADALGATAQRGTIALNGGTLRLRADASTAFSNPFQLLASSALEAAPITTGTPILSLGALTIGSQVLTLAANGGATLALAGANLTAPATFNATAGTTTLGAVTGAFGFTKTGAGTLELTSPSTYSGTTDVQGGTLRLANAAAIPVDSAVNVGPAGTVHLNNLPANFGSITGTGGITLGTATLTVGGNLAASNFGGIISGSGGLIKTGQEILTLSGANTYSGPTTITAGSIQLAASDTLPSATSVAIAAGSRLDLAGYDQTVAALSDAGTVDLGTGTLTVGTATDTTFAGNFTGAGAVVKTGAGKLSLSGASALTGQINVAAGTLEVLAPAALGADGGATNILAGARLTLATGVVIGTEPLTLAGSGPAGAGALELPSGTASWNGPITLTLAGTVGSSGTLTLGGAVALAGRTLTIAGTGETIVTGSISGSGAVTKTGSGTLTLSEASTHAGQTTVSAGYLRIQDSAALGASGTGNETEVQSGATLVLDNPGGIATDEAFLLAAQGVSGEGAIWVPAGDNTLAGPITLTADSTVNVDLTAFLTMSAIGETGSGRNLTKKGLGVLTLSSANTFTGNLLLNEGSVRTAGDNIFGGLSGLALAAGTTLDLNDFSDSLGELSGAGTISFGPIGGGTLTVGARGTNTTFSGMLSGIGDFVKTGGGSLAFTTSGAIPSTVPVSVEGGTLDVGATNQTTGPVVVANNSFLSGTGTLTALTYELRGGTVSARLTGTNATLLVSEGDNYLTSVATYTGATQIDAGTLDIAPTGGLSGTSGVTIAAGAMLLDRGVISSSVAVSGTLAGTGSATGTVTVNAGGAISPGTDNSVGTFATGPLSLSAGGTYRLTLDSGSSTADKINATGSISLGTGVATLAVTDLLTQSLLHGTPFTILKSTTGVSGFFNGLPQGAFFTAGANNFQISYAANSGRDVTITVVPEPTPAMLLLFSMGMLRILGLRRSHRVVQRSGSTL